MTGLFDGSPLERPVTCHVCNTTLDQCTCPRNADGDIIFPKDQPIRISLEKRRKGKMVTVASGFDPVASDMQAILKRLKSSCAAGGSITVGAIEIQGDHGERFTELIRQLGYPVHARPA